MSRGARPIVVRLLPVLDFGGVESRVVLQAALHDRDAYDLRVVAFDRPGQAAARIAEAGIPVEVLGTSPAIRNPRATAALLRYLRRVRPAVLHASIAEANLHGAVAGALAGVPARIVEEVGVPVRSRRGRALHGAVMRLAHRVVGVTAATVDWLATEERLPRDRLALVYNCGKPQYFGPVTRRARTGPLRIVTAGRLVWQKDHARLVTAFAASGLDAELWIAGEGPLRAEIEAEIAARGVGDRVRLLGFRDDIRALLDEADVFVLPSVSEGCSVALIEAMASGIPCLASEIPGNVEVIGALGADALAPPASVPAWADALRAFAARSPDEREALGRRGREIAIARFSPSAYLERVASLYRGVLHENGRSDLWP